MAHANCEPDLTDDQRVYASSDIQFPTKSRAVLLYLMIDRFGFETRESHKYKPASIFEPND